MALVPDTMPKYIYNFCADFLCNDAVAFNNHSISSAKIMEMVKYADRDLERLSLELDDKIARQKFAGYYAFWFAKIAPISAVYRKDGDEIVDVSERAAVYLLYDLMVKGIGMTHDAGKGTAFSEADAKKVGFDKPAIPPIWEQCEYTCKGECFMDGFQRYLSFHEWQNYEYLIRLLRHRPSGPYTLVTLLESVVIASCKSKKLALIHPEVPVTSADPKPPVAGQDSQMPRPA